MTQAASDVEARVRNACDQFMIAEIKLLELDSSERSITHKLAEYLQQEFSGWNVDCEYNRDGHDPKSVVWDGCDHSMYKRRRVFPDIVIHKRGSNENLVVSEAKKSTNSGNSDHDTCKMRAYKNSLGYQLGYFVTFPIGKYESSCLKLRRWPYD